MLRIMASATATESTFRAAVKTLDETFPYADRGCLTDVVKIVVSDEKKFTKCLGAVLHMSDFFLIDDPERLASVRRLLLRVYKRPESLQETKRELLNLLTRWSESSCTTKTVVSDALLDEEGSIRAWFVMLQNAAEAWHVSKECYQKQAA